MGACVDGNVSVRTPRAEGGAGTLRSGPKEEGEGRNLLRPWPGRMCGGSARNVPAPPSVRGAEQPPPHFFLALPRVDLARTPRAEGGAGTLRAGPRGDDVRRAVRSRG